MRPRTICYFGTYEADYDRNRILQRALRSQGVEVRECHEDLWSTRRHKTGTFGDASAAATLALEAARSYLRLTQRYLRSSDEHDAVFVGYLGHLDVLVAAPLCRLRGKPLIFDAFISLYDTLVFDRRLFAEGSVPARAAALLDTLATRLADVVLLDTQAHADYFVEAFGADPARCFPALVGADPDVFAPLDAPMHEPFTVLHYSKVAPLHGVEHILEAAARLPDVRFLLVGSGQLEAELEASLARRELANVERRAWVEPHELREMIARAGVCLGIFGATPKAGRVIPNKIYQCMAVGAPIVTRDSPAIRELLVDREHALLCNAADGAAIADAIEELRSDPALRLRLRTNARARFLERCTTDAIGRTLLRDLASVP